MEPDSDATMVQAISRAEEKREQTRAMNFNTYRMAAEGYNGRCYVPGADEASPVELTTDWTAR